MLHETQQGFYNHQPVTNPMLLALLANLVLFTALFRVLGHLFSRVDHKLLRIPGDLLWLRSLPFHIPIGTGERVSSLL